MDNLEFIGEKQMIRYIAALSFLEFYVILIYPFFWGGLKREQDMKRFYLCLILDDILFAVSSYLFIYCFVLRYFLFNCLVFCPLGP